jgi:hypothetical protein
MLLLIECKYTIIARANHYTSINMGQKVPLVVLNKHNSPEHSCSESENEIRIKVGETLFFNFLIHKLFLCLQIQKRHPKRINENITYSEVG